MKMIRGRNHYISEIIPVTSNGAKKINLNLIDPKLEYVTIMAEYCYEKFEEYYILAYIFTIENRSIDSPISDRVIIPTVEGFGLKETLHSATHHR